MSTQLKLRRGTTAQHSTFTGASGEVTVDTDKKAIVVHDGATAGGFPQVSNQPTTRPSIRPSLLLDFANTKQLDPRITFSRASTGTYYDGKTVVKAEENLLIQSQAFDNAAWANIRCTDAANTDTAPDGTLTADSILQTTGQTSSGSITQAISVSNTNYVMSVFAKPNGKNFLRLTETLSTGSTVQTVFDVSTGTIGTTGAGHTATITASTNGYYRCSILISVNSARSGLIGMGLADTNGSTVVVDSGGLYLWGAQLEQRSTATAYTPTTTAPITNYIPALQTAAANVARFDHDPITGESKGLLIEEQRTNLLTYSEQFDNAAWTKTRASITANTIVAPDGTLTGDKLVEDTTATNSHLVQSGNISFTSGASYTLTVYAKASERSWLRILFGTAAFGAQLNGYFDLVNGSVGSLSAGVTASITSVGNGWYRCSITATATATASTTIIYGIATVNGVPTYTGDGYSGIFVWGAQLEAGSFPTSYIPTVASQVTRSADSASMTGSNFSSWYRADEGSWYAEANQPVTLGTGKVHQFVGVYGASGNAYDIRVFNGTIRYAVANTSTTLGNDSTNAFDKVAIGYTQQTTFAQSGSLNGAAIVSSTTSQPRATDAVEFGSGGNNLNGHIKRIAYYPKRLSNTELQGLTS